MPPRVPRSLSLPDPIKLVTKSINHSPHEEETGMQRQSWGWGMLVDEAGKPHDDEGREWGDYLQPTLPETANKPLEARGQVETGFSLYSLKRNNLTNP